MSDLAHDQGFVELADRCWAARWDFLDVNAGLVGGERGLVVVDSLSSDAQARRLVEAVRRLGVGEVVAVVNTHVHFDHTFGNRVLSEEYGGPPVLAHEEAAAVFEQHAEAVRAQMLGDATDPRHAEVATTRPLPPTDTFSSARAIDLGDRLVEVLHPGRGHTAGDAVVLVEDADVLFAGDLVEESTVRSGVPGFGADCYPIDWPASLDLVVSMLREETVVVPGHGAPVDRGFVQEQRSSIGVVAETIRDLASRGVPVAQALDATEWPYPKEELRHAVARGYAHLPRASRSLPLI